MKIELKNMGTATRNKLIMNLPGKDRITFYFSYETIVAFSNASKLVVRKNEWGPATGRFLNELDQKNGTRYTETEFNGLLKMALR